MCMLNILEQFSHPHPPFSFNECCTCANHQSPTRSPKETFIESFKNIKCTSTLQSTHACTSSRQEMHPWHTSQQNILLHLHLLTHRSDPPLDFKPNHMLHSPLHHHDKQACAPLLYSFHLFALPHNFHHTKTHGCTNTHHNKPFPHARQASWLSVVNKVRAHESHIFLVDAQAIAWFHSEEPADQASLKFEFH